MKLASSAGAEKSANGGPESTPPVAPVGTNSGHPISPTIATELLRLRLQVRPFSVADAVWRRLLRESERVELGGNPRAAYLKCQGTVGMWMQVRGGTYERGLLEILYGLDRISERRFHELLEAIGESAPGPSANSIPRPKWDGDACNLYYDGELVRQLQGRSRARNVVLILDAFEGEDWPDFIDNPLPGDSDLNQTVKSLNKALQLIRFRSTSGGVAWEPVSPRRNSQDQD